LDDPGFDSHLGQEIFLLCKMSGWAVGPCALLFSGYWGGKAHGVWICHSCQCHH